MAQADPADERRKGPRLREAAFATVADADAPRRLFGACVLDRSPGGLSLRLGRPLAVGSVLLVRPGPGGGPPPGRVEVRHCRPEGGGWVAGCQVIRPAPPAERGEADAGAQEQPISQEVICPACHVGVGEGELLPATLAVDLCPHCGDAVRRRETDRLPPPAERVELEWSRLSERQRRQFAWSHQHELRRLLQELGGW